MAEGYLVRIVDDLYLHCDAEAEMRRLIGEKLATGPGLTVAEIRDLLGKPGGKTLHLTREKCVAQIKVLEQQKRNIEISIAELRQIYSSFYKKLLETG